MCGVAGFSRVDGTSSIPDGREFGVDLAHSIRDRGTDAVGFGWFTHTGDVNYWKAAGDPFQKAMDAPLPLGLRTLIAHTRLATQGNPKVNDNNHPVVAPGIVLVHNGGVWNDDELFRAVDAPRKAEVDSEALAALLSYGPDAFGASHPSELLSLMEGSAAIAWLDTDQVDVLHLARIAERPLALGRTRRGDLVFGSTPANLDKASKWGRLTITDVQIVPEGTYLMVRRGEVIDRRTFAVPARPTRWTRPARHVNTSTATTTGKPKHRKGGSKPKRGGGSQLRFPSTVDRIGAVERFLRGEGPDPYASPLTKPEGSTTRWSTKDQAWVPVDGTGA